VELFFETQMMVLQTAQDEELSDEELRLLMAPTYAVLVDVCRWIAGYFGRRLSTWGGQLEQVASAE
jgi:hypothetical protein